MRLFQILRGCLLFLASCSLVPGGKMATVSGADPPGGGMWQPGWLEIHHIDAGQATSTLVVGPTGRSMLVDAGEADWEDNDGALIIGPYIKSVLGSAHLDYVLISHFHVDHTGYPGFGGLWHLVNVQGFTVGKLLHRDFSRYVGEGGGTLARWREYLAGEGQSVLHPQVATLGDGQIDLGAGVAVRLVAVDGNGLLVADGPADDPAPPSENDYSVAFVLRFGQLDYFSGGDLSGETLVSGFGYSYHDIEYAVAPLAKDVDVYRVSHHGSAHSSSPTFLAELQPRVSILEVGNDNPDGHPHQATIDRLAPLGAIYLTEGGDAHTNLRGARVVGHVVLRSADGIDYWVADDHHVATDPPRVDADGDGYFQEADPDDTSPVAVPAPRGGCEPSHQACR
jgi:beta-lactamase superfamily II metal-dependent hydrolase